MNWGGFAGGFSSGLKDGFSLAKAYKQGKKEREVEDIRAKGIAEATAARNAEIEGMVKESADSTSSEAAKPVEQQREMTQKVDQANQAVTGEAAAPVAAAPSPAPTVTQSVVGQPANLPGDPLLADQPPQALAVEQPQATASTLPPQGGQPAPQVVQGQQVAQAPAGNPAAAGGIGGRFTVGGQSYGTREEAMAAASKKVPDISEYVTKTIAPKMKEFYVANGDIEQAEKFGKFIDSERGRGAIKAYGTAMNKLMFTDDIDGGIDALGDYYNKYVDDGVDFKGGKRLDDGTIEVTTVTGKGKSAKESKMILTPQEIVRIGMAHDPVKLYDMLSKQVETQQATSAEIAKEARKQDREDAREARKHENAVELKSLDAQLDGAKPGDIGKKARDLKALGWKDDAINDFLRNNEHKKTTDPTERRAIVTSELIKSDPTFSRKSAEEQAKIVDKTMSVIYGNAPTQSENPAASGMPAAPSAGKGKGVPVYDTKTGGIVYK